MNLKITSGDITELKVDAFINPANEDLILGGEIAGRLLDRCGYELQEICDRLEPIRTTEAVATPFQWLNYPCPE